MIGDIHQACLLLGSNIEPIINLNNAINLLRQHANIDIEKISEVWKTQAVGSTGPDFLNVALLVRTNLNAIELKENILRPLENQLGRIRVADKNAPRPIDLDIIIFDQLLLDSDLWKRAHCAVPVSEILPYYCSEEGVLLKDVAEKLSQMTPMTLMPNALQS